MIPMLPRPVNHNPLYFFVNAKTKDIAAKIRMIVPSLSHFENSSCFPQSEHLQLVQKHQQKERLIRLAQTVVSCSWFLLFYITNFILFFTIKFF